MIQKITKYVTNKPISPSNIKWFLVFSTCFIHPNLFIKKIGILALNYEMYSQCLSHPSLLHIQDPPY